MERKILDVLNTGIVILDSHYNVVLWNQWMEINSEVEKEIIEGTHLFNHFPQLNTPFFTRSIKSVLKFGNYVYFSQKLHTYLFPFPAKGIYAKQFEFMQQSCSLVPLASEIEGEEDKIVLTVQNVTESVYLEQNLKIMTRQDGLTGLYNRRYLDIRLDEELKRFQRSRRVFSLLMLDIDNFKLVNDKFGHPFGDHVLKNLGSVCSGIIRGSDIAARFGGEEFAVVLLDTPVDGAMIFAERIRREIEKMVVTNEEGVSLSVTVSLGAATVSDDILSAVSLIENADKALYASKKNGKNCVTVYDPEIHNENSLK
ncbi:MULTISPECIES: GGDEF domain-containing protein [unclassified Oceanispirochaeta]|uniref:GGDEF domain-containing protein n=1 Tax=unclassified Oceanispirochaeta TaxID=2635722 RepID=UPI000E09A3DA|nr:MULTISPECIES: GGDEF domain-containing protein [unclassified Oceanispirochaeta]MBF9014971.1 GGDEF domain-containing protein [Oceanispirochaeta sp. M2]NPD71348.1 GGDEF domain-containing protein [Oceanispirochaeta sp. M1]RDG33314.1 GGDEF domain-containing protein [Oceanispirochaeta sp. M1]